MKNNFEKQLNRTEQNLLQKQRQSEAEHLPFVFDYLGIIHIKPEDRLSEAVQLTEFLHIRSDIEAIGFYLQDSWQGEHWYRLDLNEEQGEIQDCLSSFEAYQNRPHLELYCNFIDEKGSHFSIAYTSDIQNKQVLFDGYISTLNEFRLLVKFLCFDRFKKAA